MKTKDKSKITAEFRVNRALDKLELIRKLSNRGIYQLEIDDIPKMILALRTSIDEIEESFNRTYCDSYNKPFKFTSNKT